MHDDLEQFERSMKRKLAEFNASPKAKRTKSLHTAHPSHFKGYRVVLAVRQYKDQIAHNTAFEYFSNKSSLLEAEIDAANAAAKAGYRHVAHKIEVEKLES